MFLIVELTLITCSAVLSRKLNDLRLLLMLYTPVVRELGSYGILAFEVFPYAAEISIYNVKNYVLVSNYFIINFY